MEHKSYCYMFRSIKHHCDLVLEQNIDHMRQECHNSKFGIFYLWVQKETFADALFNRYSVITQFVKLAAREQLCRRCTHRKL
jgi:hypothetical protein